MIEPVIKLHLKINQKLNHDYFWDWKPETNNVSYLMPEVGVDAMLYFPTDKEKDGVGIECFLNGNYWNQNTTHKELTTINRKEIHLDSDQVHLATEGGEVSVMDQGIELKSSLPMQLSAQGVIRISGESVDLSAQQRIVLASGTSNIELFDNINLYGANGVAMIPREPISEEVVRPSIPEKSINMALYYKTMYYVSGAISSINLSADPTAICYIVKVMDIFMQEKIRKK